MAKLYSVKKKSIMTVGSFVFVHGGISRDLARKYTIAEINSVVTKWMCKNNTSTEEKMFDEIFRDDDDMSPFWCRIYAEEDNEGENTEAIQRILNLQPRQLFQEEQEELEKYKHRQELSSKGLGIVEKIMEEQKLCEGDYIEMCNIFKELYK